MPAHCDAVLRRHFWFWASSSYNSSANLNTAAQLLGMHLTSVGRGCNMVLDMSPTPTVIPATIPSASSHPAIPSHRQRLCRAGLAAGE